MTRFEAIEASRIARGQRDTTAPVADESQQYGGRTTEIEPNGLRFRFQFPGEGRRKPGFAGMTPERRVEISRKANEARKAKLSAKRRSEIAAAANAARFGRPQ